MIKSNLHIIIDTPVQQTQYLSKTIFCRGDITVPFVPFVLVLFAKFLSRTVVCGQKGQLYGQKGQKGQIFGQIGDK